MNGMAHPSMLAATKRRGTPAAIQTLLDRLATNKQRYLEQGICDPGQLDQISSGVKGGQVEVYLYFQPFMDCLRMVPFHWVGVGEVAGAPGTYMNHSCYKNRRVCQCFSIGILF